jgi:Zn/Cd-binding protein ZinT
LKGERGIRGYFERGKTAILTMLYPHLEKNCAYKGRIFLKESTEASEPSMIQFPDHKISSISSQYYELQTDDRYKENGEYFKVL